MSKQERPEWSDDGIWGSAWWSTRGNREIIINHMGERITRGEKAAEEMLDHFLKENPEAANYFKKNTARAYEQKVKSKAYIAKLWASTLKAFDESQPRDNDGKWTSGGGGGKKSIPKKLSKSINKLKKYNLKVIQNKDKFDNYTLSTNLKNPTPMEEYNLRKDISNTDLDWIGTREKDGKLVAEYHRVFGGKK